MTHNFQGQRILPSMPPAVVQMAPMMPPVMMGGAGGLPFEPQQCFDFRAGKCMRGSRCKYSHAGGPPNILGGPNFNGFIKPAPPEAQQPCYDYRAGKCMRGDGCKYSH